METQQCDSYLKLEITFVVSFKKLIATDFLSSPFILLKLQEGMHTVHVIDIAELFTSWDNHKYTYNKMFSVYSDVNNYHHPQPGHVLCVQHNRSVDISLSFAYQQKVF